MKPISPVLPGENFQEIIVAEHQDEYLNLPIIKCNEDGLILSRWELSDEEIQTVAETKSVWLFMHTFGNPVTPVSLQVEKPETEAVPPPPEPELEIMIAPRWAVESEVRANQLGLQTFKKKCDKCNLTTMVAESTVNYLKRQPKLKIICVVCAPKEVGGRDEHFILKEGVQELTKAIEIKNANQN